MFTYWIAGVPSCPNFGHAKLVAEKLRLSLPHFSYKVIVKSEKEYQNWLRNFCHEQKWKIYHNPLVWKRISNLSGPCHLIGDINEFFEHLVEYYDVDTRLDERIKQHMVLDNKERMSLTTFEDNLTVYRPTPRKVCITGALYPSTNYLVTELLQLKALHTEGGVTIYLHHKNVNKYGDLIKIKNEMSDCEFNVRGHDAVVVINSLEAGLMNCDLLIVIGNEERGEKEDRELWINRNHSAMKSLASIFNRHCPQSCKVLLVGMEHMLCFNLSVLAENADHINLYNIIGVTAHHGMEQLPEISRATGIPVSELHCPPVWGFIGMVKYLDLNHVVYRHYRDTSTVSSTVNRGNSSGDRGDETTEYHDKYLQTILLQSNTTNLMADIDDNSMDRCGDVECITNLAKPKSPLSCLPEVRATITLISEWFEQKNNITVSAAIFSDGTFGLKFGMFLSQPVCIENGQWKPNFNFPPPDEKIIRNIVSKVLDIQIEYNLGKRFSINKKESLLQHTCII